MRYLSLFSGIEAATCAWRPLGWEAVAFAEIDKFASAVLSHHYPDVPNLGDLTRIQDEDIQTLGPIDLVVGGFPCQDVSVAGKRKGFKNEDGSPTRSGLFFDAMRLVRAANPRWLLIENVPGLYSSNGGRDFASVVGEILGVSFDVPQGGWRSSGVAAGPRGRVEWATLDAQFFGLAQRRKRVFLVANFGNWADTPPVLLEPESMQGHPTPRRESGQNIAPTISARTKGGGGLGTDFDLDGGLIAGTLGQRTCDHPSGLKSESDFLAVYAIQERAGCENPNAGPNGVGVQSDIAYTLEARQTVQAVAFGGNNTSGALEVAAALNAKGGTGRCDFESETLIAFDCKASGRSGFGIGETAPTLRAMNHSQSHQNGGGQVAVAFALRGREGGAMPELEGDIAGALRAASGGSSRSYAAGGFGVRRITPREAERLQGFPDNYTLVPLPLKGRQTRVRYAADGSRYKTLGNSFAVPVIEWIGRQIQEADQACRDGPYQL